MASPGLYCTRCGQVNDPQAAFCAKCGAPQPGAAPSGTPAASPAGGGPTATGYAAGYAPVVPRAIGYGGFWIRFVAIVIDAIVIGAALTPVRFMFFGSLAMSGGFPMHHGRDIGDLMPLFAMGGKMFLIERVAWWLYDALMTASTKQGTLGKMIFGLKVTDTQGQRLSFAHATGRHFAKYISAFTVMIGFIIAGFTEKKQALHDLIAGTVVIKTTN